MDATEAGGHGPAPAPQPWAVPRQELIRAPRELPVRSAGWRRMDLTTACFEGAAEQNLMPLFTTCCQQPCPSSTEGVMCCGSCSALSVEKDNAFSIAGSSHCCSLVSGLGFGMQMAASLLRRLAHCAPCRVRKVLWACWKKGCAGRAD